MKREGPILKKVQERDAQATGLIMKIVQHTIQESENEPSTLPRHLENESRKENL